MALLHGLVFPHRVPVSESQPPERSVTGREKLLGSRATWSGRQAGPQEPWEGRSNFSTTRGMWTPELNDAVIIPQGPPTGQKAKKLSMKGLP